MKEKTTSFQLLITLYIGIITTGMLMMPRQLYRIASLNLWLSIMIGSLLGYFSIIVITLFLHTFKNKTLTEITEETLGPYLGRALTFIFIFLTFYCEAYFVRQYTNFISTNFYPKTPNYIIIGSLVMVCCFAVYHGIEVICRCALIALPFILLFFSLGSLLSVPGISFVNLLPILDKGLVPPLSGASVSLAWFSEFMLLSMCTPFIRHSKTFLRDGFNMVTITLITLLILIVSILLLLSAFTGVPLYPYIVSVSYISIGRFFEHIEALVMAIWIVGAFVKISFYLFVIVHSSASFLRLSSYKLNALPISFLLFLFSLWIYPSAQSQIKIGSPLINTITILVNLFYPLLILGFVLFKKKNMAY
ncbi:endospore germination permease [Terrilactibacillus sp. BCM23-1]|uniref:Endospore germination permease n=1 Tax=Terrilactibacillus tamarindi TaxID=2599694 RepID=A0A6N8CPG3_9BACI|nr:endospore germination permease [Terrilactibacillus tamarindi]MTT30775.1 endospore germination permease [Terrilactibacillus tamarindi]